MNQESRIPLDRWALMLTMAVWGLNLSAVKLLAGRFETLPLACLRMVLATAAMTYFASRGRGALRSLTLAQFSQLILCAIFMVYGNQILLLQGMRSSAATNAALIVALSPIAALLVGALAFRERISARSLFGVALGFGGVALVVTMRPGATIVAGASGDLLLLLSVVSFAVGGAIVQGLARAIDTMVISWAIHAAGAFMLVVHAALSDARWMPTAGTADGFLWIVLILSGAVATGFGNLVWNKSISRIGVGRTTSALYWVPVFGIGFAVLTLGEALSIWHLLGLAAIVAGTSISMREGRGP